MKCTWPSSRSASYDLGRMLTVFACSKLSEKLAFEAADIEAAFDKDLALHGRAGVSVAYGVEEDQANSAGDNEGEQGEETDVILLVDKRQGDSFDGPENAANYS